MISVVFEGRINSSWLRKYSITLTTERKYGGDGGKVLIMSPGDLEPIEVDEDVTVEDIESLKI